MPITDWCELKMLDEFVDAVPQMYMGLFTAAPSAGGEGGTEVSGEGYARILVPFGAPATDAGGRTSMANTEAFAFPRAETSWGDVSAWGVWDAQTGGHLLWFQEFITPQAVLDGCAVAVREGCISLALE